MKKVKAFLLSKAGRVTVVTATVAMVLLLNALLLLGVTSHAVYPDLTPEQLYTVSPALHDLCDKLKGDVTVTFCDDPDRLLGNTASRYVYILAQKLANRHARIHLETVNIQKNPTAVYAYRPTSATIIHKDDVIISSGGRYRVYAADSFWTVSEEQKESRYWSFNGEYKLATAMLSVTAVSQPKVYFTYGHGEAIYVSPADSKNSHLLPYSQDSMKPFYDLLQSEGLEVGYLAGDTMVSVPDDCVLLVMNNPQTDYTDGDIYAREDNSATDAIHRYLAEKSGAFMLFLDPKANLPTLTQLMAHWGICYDGVKIKDNTSPTGNNQILSAELNSDQNQMSYGVYKDLVSLQSPPRLVMPYSGSVSSAWHTHESATSSTANVTAYYSSFLSSSKEAYAFHPLTDELAEENARSFDLCALTARIRTDAITSEAHFSYVFGSACPDMIEGDYLSDSAYGNYDVVFALIRYMSRTDEYASMDLGGTSLNSVKMGGKPIVYGDLKQEPQNVYRNGKLIFTYRGMTPTAKVRLTLLTAVLPVVITAAVGTALCLRRRR